jgi:hypothetical protein
MVNGLFRYSLKGIPFRQQVPDKLALKPVAFVLPEDFGSDQFFWEILTSIKRVGGDSLVLENGLLERRLWGYSTKGYGSGNAGPKAMAFADLLNDIVESEPTFSYCDLGNRIQYFVEDGIVHVCSSKTAKERWLKWWDAQSEEYKGELSKNARPAGGDERKPATPIINK